MRLFKTQHTLLLWGALPTSVPLPKSSPNADCKETNTSPSCDFGHYLCPFLSKKKKKQTLFVVITA